MHTFDLICLLIACVLFGIAGLGGTFGTRNLVALGLLAFALVPLVHTIRAY